MPYRGNLVRDGASTVQWLSLRKAEAVIDPELPIIDAHHHLWHIAGLGLRYLFDEFQQDLHAGHRIVSTVFVEGGAMYRTTGPEHLKPVGEVEFARSAAEMAESGLYGETRVAQAIVGYADMRLGSAVREVLEAQCSVGGGRLRGVRHYTVHDEGEVGRYIAKRSPPHLLSNSAFRQGVAELKRFNLTFDAWVYHSQIDDVVELAKAFPDLIVVLNHGGTPIGVAEYASDGGAVFSAWRKSMAELARLDNVVVKLGGLGMPVCGYGFEELPLPPSSEELAQAWGPAIETCVELFGPDRCMFESNFPVDRQSCGYTELWNAFKRVTRSFSGHERRSLFSDCAARVYRIDTPQITDAA